MNQQQIRALQKLVDDLTEDNRRLRQELNDVLSMGTTELRGNRFFNVFADRFVHIPRAAWLDVASVGAVSLSYVADGTKERLTATHVSHTAQDLGVGATGTMNATIAAMREAAASIIEDVVLTREQVFDQMRLAADRDQDNG